MISTCIALPLYNKLIYLDLNVLYMTICTCVSGLWKLSWKFFRHHTYPHPFLAVFLYFICISRPDNQYFQFMLPCILSSMIVMIYLHGRSSYFKAFLTISCKSWNCHYGGILVKIVILKNLHGQLWQKQNCVILRYNSK